MCHAPFGVPLDQRPVVHPTHAPILGDNSVFLLESLHAFCRIGLDFTTDPFHVVGMHDRGKRDGSVEKLFGCITDLSDILRGEHDRPAFGGFPAE